MDHSGRRRADGADPRSQVVGLASLRYVVGVEPLASAPADDVVRWHGPAIQTVADNLG
ncbi:hypothetical protein [uncultured Aeromicrobium sp.]|uniref:TetR/AcrR family transcriptional regulator n=1 Tax=uncultured Aeromicrobium sp. TaxID=337820 RepID=UPI0034202D33